MCQPEYGTCTTATYPSQPTSTGSVRNVPRPLIGNVPYGQVIESCVNEGDISITYDDGPYIYTSDLLDILANYSVKATFFIVGNNGNGQIDQVPQWTSVIQRMDNEGHQIGSHTWTHPDLTTLTSAARYDQMYQNEQAFSNILGKFPTYMRPPYLSFDDACAQDMKALGYHVISTNLDTKDYENDDPVLIQNSEATFNDTITQTAPSSSSYIVLNHDIHNQTVYTLTAYEILRAKANGYNLVTVGECLGDPEGNWYRAAPATKPLSANAAMSAPMASTSMPPPTNVCTYTDDPSGIARLMKKANCMRQSLSEAAHLNADSEVELIC